MNLQEVSKSSINSVCTFPDEYASKILKMVLVAFQQNIQDCSRIIDNFSHDTAISREQIYEVVGVYIGLIRLFLESSDNEFNAKLFDIGFTQDFIDKLPLIGHREEIVKNLSNNFITDIAISSLKWKIDISLSGTFMNKIPTSIILCLVLKNGNKYTIEVEAKMFHKLRFNTALIIKELTTLKSNYLNT